MSVGGIEPRPQKAHNRHLIASLLLSALSASFVSGMGGPLIPTISGYYGISLEQAHWILTGTLMVGAIAIPTAARLGDGTGLKWTLTAALGLVGAGSVICAVVPTFTALVVGRSLHGVGYAVVPLTIAVAKQRLHGETLRLVLMMLSVSVTAGAGIGYPLAGFLVDALGYRFAFLSAIVMSGCSLAYVVIAVPSTRGGASAVGRFDVRGAVLASLALFTVVLAISRANVWGWTALPTVGTAVASLGLLMWWIAHDLRCMSPLVDFRVVVGKELISTHLSAFVTGFAVFGGMAMISRLAQEDSLNSPGLGASMFVAGLLQIPLAGGGVMAILLMRTALRRLANRFLLGVGCLTIAVAFSLFWIDHNSIAAIAAVIFLLGIGTGIAYSAMPALILANAPRDRISSAAGANQLLRVLGGCLGSAVLAAVATRASGGADLPTADDAYSWTAAICVASAVISGVLAVSRRMARERPTVGD